MNVIFNVLSAMYPILFFLFLLILDIPIRVFSIIIIALALFEFFIRFLNKTNEKKSVVTYLNSIFLFIIGALCFVINTNMIFKFYPVLINILLLYTFGITLFQPQSMIYRFAVLIDKTIPGSPKEKEITAYCYKVTVIWSLFFIFNGSMAALTALFASDYIWFIYNGPICGILTGSLFAGEYIVRKIVQRNNNMTIFQEVKMNLFKSGMFFYTGISAPFRLKQRKKLRFETDLTGHCNLNCNYCNHFSPLIENEFVNTASLEKDFARLSHLFGRDNENIDLMGGEPLLHPDIIKIIEISRKYFDGQINIVTNGLLLPKMSEDFWLSCKKNNIKIKVTNYPINLNRKLIKKTAKQYAVKLKMPSSFIKHTWCRLPKDIKGEQDIKDNFKNCVVANICIFLKDGKLSTCCLPLIIGRFNNYFSQKFEVTEKDYIDIYSENDKNKIFNFLSKPMPFCRYCKIRKWDVGIKWGVSKKDIYEWID